MLYCAICGFPANTGSPLATGKDFAPLLTSQLNALLIKLHRSQESVYQNAVSHSSFFICVSNSFGLGSSSLRANVGPRVAYSASHEVALYQMLCVWIETIMMATNVALDTTMVDTVPGMGG